MARKILLADDSVTAQNMGRKILGDAGYDVVTVNNGSAALKRVAEQKPDLIVLDVYMPGYSGLEVCQRLKDSPETSDIPILLTVGKLEPFKPEEARRVRAEAFIVKPFEASELLSALTRLEDQVVPGGKKEGHGDTETGWKARIRFPSKKKKEEAEAADEVDFTAGTANARRRGKAAEESKVVPEIPRDITPEELDALSALAAKLDVQSSAPKQNAPIGEHKDEPKKEFEVAAPVADVKTAEAATDTVNEAPQAPVVEATPAGEAPAPIPAPVIAEVVPVNVASLAESPAPVDQNDEPGFVAAAVAPVEEKIEAKAEASAVATDTHYETKATAEISAGPDGRNDEKKEETSPETGPAAAVPTAAAETVVESPKVDAPVPVAASQAETVAPATKPQEEVTAPSDQELAEALRLLTPSPAEAVAGSSAVTSWTAVAVAVDTEEAAVSLEEEMFRSHAAPATIAAMAANAVVHEVIPIAMAAAASAGSLSGSPAAPGLQVSAGTQPGAAANSAEKVSDSDEPAPVTFADAMRHDDDTGHYGTQVEAVTQVPVAEAGATSAEPVATSSQAAGGEHDMGKHDGKSEKSNGHQSRSAAMSGSNSDEARASEEAPKAMAAKADGHSPAADPTAIANIVDSVLADLRPKIVEEIAKKLSGK